MIKETKDLSSYTGVTVRDMEIKQQRTEGIERRNTIVILNIKKKNNNNTDQIFHHY